MTRRLSSAALILVVLAGAGLPRAQAPTRRATVIDALRAHPGFFHGQNIAIVGHVIRSGNRLSLSTPTGTITLASREPLGDGPMELRGVLLDIGRLTQDDARLIQFNLRDAMQAIYGERWPRPGEELWLAVTSTAPPPAAAGVSTPAIRDLALQPERFDGERVTVIGQFRGRNLYGDTPAAPAGEREDFVLRAGDGAVWVTKLRPRGQGFTLDPTRRVDTGRWLRVSGTVRHARGLVWIEGTALGLAEPPGEAAAEVAVPPPPPPPVEILFSAPTLDETDVRPDTSVRIQFSRDLNAATLKDRVRATLPDGQVLPVALEYTPANRALEIRFASPLPRFQRVTVDLLEGIVGPDGGELRPWSLSFTTGG